MHPPETKAKAIALMLAGNTPSFVAKELGIAYPTVKRWALESHEIVAMTAAQIGDLVVESLKINLEAISKIAQHAGDKDWLNKQNASDLAILYGVLSDKSIRVLEAMHSNSSPQLLSENDEPPIEGEVS